MFEDIIFMYLKNSLSRRHNLFSIVIVLQIVKNIGAIQFFYHLKSFLNGNLSSFAILDHIKRDIMIAGIR